MTVPIKAESFVSTPKSLKEIEGAPKFTIRYGTRRDRNTFQREVARRGLVGHSQEDIQDLTLSEIRRLSRNSDEEKEKMVDAATRFWAAGKSLEMQFKEWIKICAQAREEDPNAVLPPSPELDFDPDEEAWITATINQVSVESTRLSEMRADNARREQLTREISLSIVLVDAEGFELKRRQDGVIEIACINELCEWLGERSEELGLSFLDSVDPFHELATECFAAFFLPEETRKNFASPPPTTSSPESSTQQPEAEEVTTSKASANSKATPDISSEPTISTSSTSPSAAETDGEESNGQMDGH